MMDGESAAFFVGEKIIEMCERVEVADRVAPGSQATYAVEIDGITYRIVASVAKRS